MRREYKYLVPFIFLINILIGNSFAQERILVGPPISQEEYMEYAPSLSPDGKYLFFESDMDGNWRLYYAEKIDDDKWSEPKLITAISEGGNDYDFYGAPFITHDGEYLYYTSDRADGVGGIDIWYIKFDNGEWGTPVCLPPPVNTESYDGFATVSPDGNTIYFVRDSYTEFYDTYNDEHYDDEYYDDEYYYEEPYIEEYDTNYYEEDSSYIEAEEYYYEEDEYYEEEYYDEYDTTYDDYYDDYYEEYCYKIFVTHRNDDGTWTEPEELPAPVASGCDENPRIMNDGKTLYFSSMRDEGYGGYDVYRSVLQDDGTWSEPENMSFMNSENNEAFISITPDGEYFIFSSGYEDMGMPDDIFMIKIPEEFK